MDVPVLQFQNETFKVIIGKKIVAVPALQCQENVEVGMDIPQEYVSERTVGQLPDVSVPQIQKQVAADVQIIPQDLVEQIGNV